MVKIHNKFYIKKKEKEVYIPMMEAGVKPPSQGTAAQDLSPRQSTPAPWGYWQHHSILLRLSHPKNDDSSGSVRLLSVISNSASEVVECY